MLVYSQLTKSSDSLLMMLSVSVHPSVKFGKTHAYVRSQVERAYAFFHGNSRPWFTSTWESTLTLAALLFMDLIQLADNCNLSQSNRSDSAWPLHEGGPITGKTEEKLASRLCGRIAA